MKNFIRLIIIITATPLVLFSESVFSQVIQNITISVSPTTICASDNVTFTATDTSNVGLNPKFQWQVNGNNVGTNSIKFSSSTLNDEDVVRCIMTSSVGAVLNNPDTSNSIKVDVNNMPSATTGGAKIICSGNAISLGITEVSGNTYSWTSTSKFTSTLANPTDAPTATITYTLVETNSTKTCSATKSAIVTVNPTPAANTGNPKTPICLGTSITLGATKIGTNTYKWTSDVGNFTSNISNPKTTPTTSTIYTLVETQKNCSKTNSIAIVVNPPPTPDAGKNETICEGDSVQVGAAVSGNIYSWTSQPAGFISSLSNPFVKPTVTTIFTLTETNSNLCSAKKSITVTVHKLPAASVGIAKTICFGTSTFIGNTAVKGNTYSWTSDPAEFIFSEAKPLVKPLNPATFILEETTSFGCSKTNSVIVTVIPLPVANAGKDTAICSGASVTIGSDSIIGNNYNWISSPTGFTSTLSKPAVTPAITTTYTLTEKNRTTTCSSKNIIIVTANPLPKADVGKSQTVCSGDSINIGAASADDHLYKWTSTPAGFTSTNANPFDHPKDTTTYTLLDSVKTTGCKKTNSVKIFVKPLPKDIDAGNDTAISVGESVILNGKGDGTFLWSPDSLLVGSTLQNPTAIAEETTKYLLKVTSKSGCSDTSSVTITMPIGDIIIPNVFTPNKDSINDVFRVRASGIINLEGKIYNRYGLIIYEWTGGKTGWNGRTVSGEEAPEGIYFYVISLETKKEAGKATIHKGYVNLLR